MLFRQTDEAMMPDILTSLAVRNDGKIQLWQQRGIGELGRRPGSLVGAPLEPDRTTASMVVTMPLFQSGWCEAGRGAFVRSQAQPLE